MKTKKHLFLIPDGVGIKNYLYSNLLDNLKKESKITIWSPLPIEEFKNENYLKNIDFTYKRLILYNESIVTRVFREAATFARLNYNSKLVNNETILVNWRTKGKGWRLKMLYKIAEFIGKTTFNSYKKILKLEEISKNNWNRDVIDKYKADLIDLMPTNIFITHQRVSNLMPICIAAKELNIPVISVIYSWDNMPKARLAITANKYLVWSEYMKEEFKIYHPEIDENNILITGTPQFEFYLDKSRTISRKEFAEKYNLDPFKRWICYSGDDRLTSPNDPIYLEALAKEITLNKELQDLIIIFRRSPADFSDRFDKVLLKYSTIIFSIDPLWNNKSNGWSTAFPTYNDIDLLYNIINHSLMVFNVGSTMAHDFAIFNKPCFYFNYNTIINPTWNCDFFYNYQHFRSMNTLNAVGWINSQEELVAKLLQALAEPDIIGPDRKKWLEKIVQHPIEDSSKNIAQILLNTN